MPPLALRVCCGSCGRVFDTGIRMGRRNFARATLASNYHTCPHCGRRGTYHKEHYIVDEDTAAGGHPRTEPNGPTADR